MPDTEKFYGVKFSHLAPGEKYAIITVLKIKFHKTVTFVSWRDLDVH